MRDVDDSTLWNVSTFDAVRTQTGTSGFTPLEGLTTLSSQLQSDLDALREDGGGSDVLQAVAACVRRRESALILLQNTALVWPLTLFPMDGYYHCAADIEASLAPGGGGLRLLSVEPPTIRLPAAARMGIDVPHFHPLSRLLWIVAINESAGRLLPEIAGRAAYRMSSAHLEGDAVAHGATATALRRLRAEIASLRDIEQWPGMDRARSVGLLNGAYLQGALMVLRTHPAARDPDARGLFGGTRGRSRS